MPKMSLIPTFANDPAICRRSIDFFNSKGFIGETFHCTDHSLSPDTSRLLLGADT
jgi:hypothetical protein